MATPDHTADAATNSTTSSDANLDAYMATEAGRLEEEFSIRFGIGLMRRLRYPGAKFDTMPILCGDQGYDKSTGLELLGSFGEDGRWTMDGTFRDLANKGVPIEHQGKVLVEMGELNGMGPTLVEEVKQFLSKRDDRYREPRPKGDPASPHEGVRRHHQ